ncbi:MAG: hypothetical protein JNK82_06205 [Myxococcaceae bacterium]|nr:hypothetical protein [Myxococcaceae bacterium]
MMPGVRPAHLPRTEDDLAVWRVYADALLERGDRLGELLAFELALPPEPDELAIQRLWALARKRCKVSGALSAGWSLGHARVLRVDAQVREKVRPGDLGTRHEPLADLAAFFKRPTAAYVERVDVRLEAPDARTFAAAMKGAPPTCREVGIEPRGEWSAEAVADLVSLMPAGVTHLSMPGGLDPGFATDRFEVLDVSGAWLTQEEQVGRVLSRTRTLQLVLGGVYSAPRASKLERVQLGRPGDAGLFEPETGALTVIARAPLYEVQRGRNIVGVRSQLRRAAAERYRPLVASPAAGGPARAEPFPNLERHADGRWTLVFEPHHKLVTGSRITYQDRELVFLEDVQAWRTYA